MLHPSDLLRYLIADEKTMEVLTSQKMAPDDDIDWINRGLFWHYIGDHEEVLEYYDLAIGLNPNSEAAWNNKGALMGDLGHEAEAIELFDRAIAINPNCYEAWYNRGTTLDELGRQQEAMESYGRANAIMEGMYGGGSVDGDKEVDPDELSFNLAYAQVDPHH
jgi:tetratricopeptide (TPR) repeat protein